MTSGQSPDTIADVICGNLREYALYTARTPGGKSGGDGEVTWVDTGSSALNRILAARLSASRADARIRELADFFGGRPLTWITGPADRPADLGARLLATGFRHQMPWRGMALVIEAPPPPVATPPGLEIRQAADSSEIAAWGRTAAAGFAMPENVARDFPAVFANLATDKIVYFLGLSDGLPVATASLFLGSAAAGAYFISTLGPARLGGVATALTRALVAHAASLGYRLLVLEASPAGYEVYIRMGFRQYCDMDAYVINT